MILQDRNAAPRLLSDSAYHHKESPLPQLGSRSKMCLYYQKEETHSQWVQQPQLESKITKWI